LDVWNAGSAGLAALYQTSRTRTHSNDALAMFSPTETRVPELKQRTSYLNRHRLTGVWQTVGTWLAFATMLQR
jgi:hypothetical protein